MLDMLLAKVRLRSDVSCKTHGGRRRSVRDSESVHRVALYTVVDAFASDWSDRRMTSNDIDSHVIRPKHFLFWYQVIIDEKICRQVYGDVGRHRTRIRRCIQAY